MHLNNGSRIDSNRLSGSTGPLRKDENLISLNVIRMDYTKPSHIVSVRSVGKSLKKVISNGFEWIDRKASDERLNLF
jgi:hypothetical protein